MVREEIVAGLKNAVARGQSLEAGMQSLIVAGYDENDVKEAAGYVDMGAIASLPPTDSKIQQIKQTLVQQKEQPTAEIKQTYKQLPNQQEIKPKKKISPGFIILIIILILLIIGVVGFIFFGETILTKLFPTA